MKRFPLAAALFSLAMPAAAQDSGWTYDLSIYGWFPKTTAELETPLGDVKGELSISDSLDALKMAFMGTFEARTGDWALVGDLIYFDLGLEGNTPFGVAFSSVGTDLAMTLASGYAFYKVYEDMNSTFEVGAGLRGYWTDTTVTLRPGTQPRRQFGASDNWVDPLLAARLRVAFDEHWFGALEMDVGGFGVGSEHAYHAVGTVGYRFNENWSVRGGYRYLSVEKDLKGNDFTVDLSGPVLGVAYQF